MKKADQRIKMADLQEVNFALMPGPARKKKQFRLPDDFYNIDVTILSRTSHPASGFPAVVYNTDRPLSGDLQFFLHDNCAARNFNISALRGRNSRLLAAVM